jgi:SNF2-related domain
MPARRYHAHTPDRPPPTFVALHVHWLRVVLDEGHVLGSANVTNRHKVVSALRAERRWVLTGTPTPATANAQARLVSVLFQSLCLWAASAVRHNS